ncbi:MAG: 2TM domain-containing protein [Parafilimonas sp.]
MNNYQQQEDTLWKVAKKRAAFKWSFSAYVFVIFFLVCVWFFSSGAGSYFWPIWPIIGWGVGILFQYLAAYQGNNLFTAEQEYERLKNQQNNQL